MSNFKTFVRHQVVLLSNSDIAFDESLARLGDPSTLDMANKVRAERTPQVHVPYSAGYMYFSKKQEGVPPLVFQERTPCRHVLHKTQHVVSTYIA